MGTTDSLGLALAIGEALGICAGGLIAGASSRRRGRLLAEDVSLGVALGALCGTIGGLCWWFSEVLSGA